MHLYIQITLLPNRLKLNETTHSTITPYRPAIMPALNVKLSITKSHAFNDGVVTAVVAFTVSERFTVYARLITSQTVIGNSLLVL